MFWKKSNTYKMISDEDTIGIWKYLEEIKVMFSGVLFDICRVSPSLEKVGVIFGYEHITPCRLINLLKLTHPLKRGMEFIFDLRICNEQIGRRIIKYYTECDECDHVTTPIHQLFHKLIITITDMCGHTVIQWNIVQYDFTRAVSYTHLRAHETPEHLVCRLLLEKKNQPPP